MEKVEFFCTQLQYKHEASVASHTCTVVKEWAVSNKQWAAVTNCFLFTNIQMLKWVTQRSLIAFLQLIP